MTLDELRAQEPDLVTQIEQNAVAAARAQATAEAVTAERERLAAIDSKIPARRRNFVSALCRKAQKRAGVFSTIMRKTASGPAQTRSALPLMAARPPQKTRPTLRILPQ